MITIEQFRRLEHQKMNDFHRVTGVRVSAVAAPMSVEEPVEEQKKTEEKGEKQ